MTYKNECIKCKTTWSVQQWHGLKLDEIDQENLENYGQLYSVCEDCSQYSECESVLRVENKFIID